jgi:hypothetical protein
MIAIAKYLANYQGSNEREAAVSIVEVKPFFALTFFGDWTKIRPCTPNRVLTRGNPCWKYQCEGALNAKSLSD